jgi:hypothetical protein
MARRVTRAKIRQRVEALSDCDIAVGWAYGGARFTNKKESKDLSPRMSTSEASIWLDGFELGVETGFELGQDH